MQMAVIYDSEFGNTRALAEAIADELRTSATVQLTNVRDDACEPPVGVDLVVVGGPTQVHGISQPLHAQLERWPKNILEDVPIAAFDTRVHGPRIFTGAASGGIARQLQKRGGRLVGSPASFFVDGREGPLGEGEVDRARTWARGLLAEVVGRVAAA